tara:strand:+ start:115 stop:399 length:285 start_codon:yes stop_codon:yes gene_type:complete
MATIDNKWVLHTDPFQYVIITINDHTTEQLNAFDSVCLSKTTTAGYNIDKTKKLYKFRGETPEILTNYTTYSLAEIDKIMLTSEWYYDDVAEEA